MFVDPAREVEADGDQAVTVVHAERRAGRPLPQAVQHEAPGLGTHRKSEVGERSRLPEGVDIVEVRGHEEVRAAAAPGHGDAPHVEAGAREELTSAVAPGSVRRRLERQPLEGRPQLGTAGDVDGSGPVDPQPDLVLVLVLDAALEGGRESHNHQEAGKHGTGILAAVESWVHDTAVWEAKEPDARVERGATLVAAPDDVVYLVDGSAQVHRAYFAIRALTTRRGLPTGATYGFTTMLRKLYQDENPPFVAMSFDLPGPTFRHAAYALYKAHRPKMDEDLSVQLPYIRRVCDAFGVPVIEAPGFEADDVIATLTRQALGRGMSVVVVSGDKDLLQLVGPRVTVLNPGREGAGSTRYDAKRVEEKFGVPPERVVDVLALVGDAVDNVPGVAGIGEKGARDLVREFGDLEAVLENVDKVKRPAYRKGLVEHRDDARLSKELVTLRTDVPVVLDLTLLERHEPDRKALHSIFTELEFFSLAKAFGPEATAPTLTPRTVVDETVLETLLSECRASGRVGVGLVQDGDSAMGSALEGLAFSWAAAQAALVPFVPTIESPVNLGRERAIALLKPLLQDSGVEKIAADGKRLRVALSREGAGFEGLGFDVRIAAYLVDPGRRSYDLGDLAADYLGERRSAGPGGEEAELAFRLRAPLHEALVADGLDSVFQSVELPLVEVIAGMEAAGVKVDVALLASMSREMEARVSALSREIHDLAGEDFNINSPTQLREVLFGRLGLRSGKKTAKTRAASTAEDVLEELALEHPLPRKILEYRGVQKLKSTYVDALPQLVNPRTGRIHATFHQTVAATGRISSSDPNLQNIPIRTSEGRRIREAFVAEEGHQLLSADYSQIELRVLAHLSKDETLIAAFRRGEDIHDRTSREIFGPFSRYPRTSRGGGRR